MSLGYPGRLSISFLIFKTLAIMGKKMLLREKKINTLILCHRQKCSAPKIT